MLVLFFHVLYLLGNYVVRRFGNSLEDNGNEADDDHDSGVEASWTYNDATMSKELKERANLKRRFSGDSLSDAEVKSTVRFNPPAFIQRYQAVQKVFAEPRFFGKLKKVVDFGCSEVGFSLYLKSMVGVEEALFVDVDRQVLERFSKKAKPLHIDYLHRRSTPLVMRVLEGNVNDHDKMLENVDAVVCIELIEHLYPEDLTNFPYSVFGFIKPKMAVVTTPNADFNVLFENMSKFRHWDHKFEWTRSQFQDWAKNITSRFPEYEVTFHGIGNGPAGTEHLGACSQMAVFHRVGDLPIERIPGTEGLLKSVDEYEYPFEIDNRSDEEKILADAEYYIRKFSINNEQFEEQVPLQMIINMMKFPVTESDMIELLRNSGWSIENRDSGPVVIIPPPTQYSDQSGTNHSMNADNFLDDEVWRSDPRPADEFMFNRENYDLDIEDDGDDWDNEPHIIVRTIEQEPRHMRNDRWENFPNHEEEDNDNSDVNTTSSIFADDMNFDDFETTSQLSGQPYSPTVELMLIAQFSENEDSEVMKISALEERDSSDTNRMELREKILNLSLETLNANAKDLTSDPVGPVTETGDKILKFNLPPFVPAKVKETSRDAELSNSANNSISNDVLQNEGNKDNNLSSCSNEVSECLPQTNKLDSRPANLKPCTGAIPKICKRNILDIKVDAQTESKSEKISPCTPSSLANSSSPEVMDSGYPNSNSPPDLSPELDLSSIAQDQTTDSESPSLEDAPRIALFEGEIQNRDLDNNNLDGEGNNLEGEEDGQINDLRPIIHVLENDLENENDIYDARNGFPAWLLRIQ